MLISTTKSVEQSYEQVEQTDALLPHWSTWPCQPLVSVLVAAWNEEAHLVAFLQSYAALPYPNTELILCAGGDDRTLAIAETWADARTIIVEQKAGDGQFGARQRCLAYAQGEFIMLTDSDCLLHGESFLRLIHPLITGQATVTTGQFCPLPAQHRMPFVFYQWTQLRYRANIARHRPQTATILVGANAALTRSLVEEVYATTTPVPIGEDTYLASYAMQAGHQILYLPESYVATKFVETFRAYVRQRSRWRRDQLIYFYRFGNRQIVWKALLSVSKHLAWLLLPLLPVLLAFVHLAHVGLILWVTIWLSTFAHYRHQHQVGQQFIRANHAVNPPADPFAFHLWKFMVADSCAVIHLAICMAIPAWRYHW